MRTLVNPGKGSGIDGAVTITLTEPAAGQGPGRPRAATAVAPALVHGDAGVLLCAPFGGPLLGLATASLACEHRGILAARVQQVRGRSNTRFSNAKYSQVSSSTRLLCSHAVTSRREKLRAGTSCRAWDPDDVSDNRQLYAG